MVKSLQINAEINMIKRMIFLTIIFELLIINVGFSQKIGIPDISPVIIPTDPHYNVVHYHDVKIGGNLIAFESSEVSLRSLFGSPTSIETLDGTITGGLTKSGKHQKVINYGSCLVRYDLTQDGTEFNSLDFESNKLWISIDGTKIQVGMYASALRNLFSKSYSNRNLSLEQGFKNPMLRILTYYTNDTGTNIIIDFKVTIILDNTGKIIGIRAS